MTKQEIFDLTVQKFIEQGECSYDDEYTCRYHINKNDKELHCLAGFYLPPDVKEGVRIDDLYCSRKIELDKDIFLEDSKHWWVDLQYQHDSVVNAACSCSAYDTPKVMFNTVKKNLKNFADRNGLEWKFGEVTNVI